MHYRNLRIFTYSTIAAFILGIVGWVTLPPDVAWIAPIVALVLILLGLGINILALINRADRNIDSIIETLKNMEQIQETIQKEQKEQSHFHSPIIPTLQAFSQLYLD